MPFGWRRFAPAALLGLSIGFPAWLVTATLTRASNVPLRDEWDWARLSFLMRTGHLQWSDIWQPHSEHRIVIPNLIFLAIDRAVGWNVLAEQLVGVVASVAAQFVLWRLIRKTIEGELPRYAALVVMSALLFSPAQFQIFAEPFGWPICTFLTIVAIAGFAEPGWSGVGFALTATLLGSMISDQCLILWFVGVFGAWYARWSRAQTLAWTFAGIVSLIVIPGNYMMVRAAASKPTNVALIPIYALIFLGTPLAYGSPSAVLHGVAPVAAVCLTVFVLVTCRSEITARRAALLPWLLCIGYASLASVAIGASRIDFGLVQATSSRYASISIFLYIGVLGLVLSNAARFRTRAVRVAIVVACAAFLGLGAIAAARGDATWARWTDERRQVGAEIGRGRFGNAAKIFPNAAILREIIAKLCIVHDSPLGCHA